jgi:outer membrane protein OmpA-like peptidoglycan-associated protein
VHEADLALQRANRAWEDKPDSPNTLDLAVIAQRKAQVAEAEANAIQAQQQAEQAKGGVKDALMSQLQQTKGQLDKSQQQYRADIDKKQQEVDRTKNALDQQTAQTEAERKHSAELDQQRKDLEAKLKDARDTIARIAAVKDDDRGMVITLQGEVLFKTGKWDLKAGAMAKLDQIADALKGKEQPITVFGYTDNVGGHDQNMDLSLKRANSVRDYLVTRGIPSDLITAQGKGDADPIAENTSTDGRQQNRRVEIVVAPKKS